MQARNTQGRRRRQAGGARQLGFEWRQHGGARRGAGRPRKTDRPPVAHRARPRALAREPQHVTLRLKREVGYLRSGRALSAVYRSLSRGCDRFGTRTVHFSVQGDHVHLLVETADALALTRAIKGLSVRIARALNKVLGRTGAAFADRYHARALRTPREVHHALGYVLCNYRHHAAPRGLAPGRWWIDPCSSGWYFTGWRGRDGKPRAASWARPQTAPRLAEARTWLLTIGWQRHGPVPVDHVPGARS